jgi:hypothetical protein
MRTLTREIYLKKYIRKIPGYLSSIDAKLISHLLQWQETQGIRGSLCEIGVHHGRLFLLLALSRRREESALAIDLFEDDTINTGTHIGRPNALLRNAGKLQVSLSSEEVIKCSSHDLTATDILSKAPGQVRFFSVDGGHLYKDVRNDLELARKCISENGIIAVDDFFNPIWPEVSFATHDFLGEHPEIVPAFVTPYKLYLVRHGNAEKVVTGALRDLPSGIYFHPQSPMSFMKDSVTFVMQSDMARIKERIWNLILS